MAKGFTDDDGKFHPTDRNMSGISSKHIKQSNPDSSGTDSKKASELKDKKKELFPEILKLPTIEYLREKMASSLKKSKYNELESEKESFEEGFDRGVAMAELSTDDLSKVKIGTKLSDLDFGADEYELGFDKIESIDQLKQFYRISAFTAEENDRSFSPFEFQAKELGERMFDEEGDQISEAYDAFDQGIASGVDAYLDQFWKLNLRG